MTICAAEILIKTSPALNAKRSLKNGKLKNNTVTAVKKLRISESSPMIFPVLSIRKGFSTDEELSVYDLLFKDDLSKSDIKAIKKIAVDLLTQIKNKIATLDHWRDKEDTRSAVNNLIRDSLFISLPQSYDDQSINRYTGLIYEHVYNRYPAIAHIVTNYVNMTWLIAKTGRINILPGYFITSQSRTNSF